MNPFRLFHRRCDTVAEHLAQTAGALTHRAETAEADLHTAQHEVREVRDDLVCTEHDLEQAHQRLRGLRGQFEQVLEGAYEAGMLYRTWALLLSSLDADSRDVLDTAAWLARIPALEALTWTHNTGSGGWGLADAPEQCVDPFCAREQGLTVVRHAEALERARMVCECGRHWGLPRDLTPVLEQISTTSATGGENENKPFPARELPWQVLAAADAALPPAKRPLATA